MLLHYRSTESAQWLKSTYGKIRGGIVLNLITCIRRFLPIPAVTGWQASWRSLETAWWSL